PEDESGRKIPFVSPLVVIPLTGRFPPMLNVALQSAVSHLPFWSISSSESHVPFLFLSQHKKSPGTENCEKPALRLLRPLQSGGPLKNFLGQHRGLKDATGTPLDCSTQRTKPNAEDGKRMPIIGPSTIATDTVKTLNGWFITFAP